MVCPIWSGEMTALSRVRDAGNILQTLTGEAGHQKLAAQYLRRELQEAEEANLLDEEDMHIFGLRPMTDPLDLVCCNACKKPLKASQYAAHAELCKSLSSKPDAGLEHDGPTVNRKPPRKERKKSTTQTKKASSLKEPKKIKGVDSEDIATRNSCLDEKIQMALSAETKTRNIRVPVPSKPKTNGSRVSPCNVNCSEDATKCLSKTLKRVATESPSNPGTTNMYPPAPLATKVYYSQTNHRLRRAICHMFFEESSKESSNEVSNFGMLQNAVPTQTSTPSNFCHEQAENQQRDDHLLHHVQTQEPFPAASSESYQSEIGGFVPSMNPASQLPMNNRIEHHLPNSYSFAGNPGNYLGTVQQGNGSVPVV
ncbi:uncharacterized protein LOC127249008 [Andrographis paniculata]|uniref:uncharacterized protein LOC127249008 n=1 Tax=Andrographis paniculata TaxID=175694 RepID=UPI0021E8F7B8|nr:uncharacterized protein LOC127249008 [Andrographis paniculata]XP_051127558.1 uncharacterized protein LOC127249008 [Andrographis paniculata]